MSFRTAIESLDISNAYQLPDSWLQGRTAYGGLTAALALAAAQQSGSEGLPPLRSAQVSFIAPVSASDWFLLRSFSRKAGSGYPSQEMEIWDEAGNLVSVGRQLVAIF